MTFQLAAAASAMINLYSCSRWRCSNNPQQYIEQHHRGCCPSFYIIRASMIHLIEIAQNVDRFESFSLSFPLETTPSKTREDIQRSLSLSLSLCVQCAWYTQSGVSCNKCMRQDSQWRPRIKFTGAHPFFLFKKSKWRMRIVPNLVPPRRRTA